MVNKRLKEPDNSGFYFAQELLENDSIAIFNSDSIMRHPVYGYLIIEFLLCSENQKITPWESHPNKYWNKNKRKFLSLWDLTKSFKKGVGKSELWLINYAKKETKNEDKILLIKVLDLSLERGITKSQ